MTQRKLERLCHKWQKRLRLRDWHISVFFTVTDKSKIDGDYNLGCCDSSPGRKTADIHILDPKLWKLNSRTPGYRGLDKEIELSLVHELIHCHFQFMKMPKDKSDDQLILEHGVESLAIAFLEMYEKK